MFPRRRSSYPVPFRVDRLGGGHIRLTNRSDEALRGIVLLLDGPGVIPARPAGALHPGDHLDVTVRGRDLPRATALIVRWSRPSGEPYLYRITF